MALHPGLAVSLALSSRPVDLLADEADIAVRIGVSGPGSLIARRLSREVFLLCAAPAYLVRSPAPRRPEDLGQHRLLDIRTDPEQRQLELSSGRVIRRVTIAPVLRSNEPEVLVDMMAVGLIVPVLPAWQPPSRDVNALFAPGRAQVPKVRAFLDFLLEALRSDPPTLAL